MKTKFSRFNNFALQKLKNFYKQNCFCFWIFILFGIVGIVVGIISCSKFTDTITKSNFLDVKFLEFLEKECSSFSLAFSYFIKFVFNTLLILVFCSSKFFSLFSYVIILYSGFCIGVDVIIIIVEFGFSGIIYVVFCNIPFFILSIVLLSVLFCTFQMRLKNSCKIKYSYYFNFDKDFIKQVLLILLVALLLFMIESFVISLTSSTIIVVI